MKDQTVHQTHDMNRGTSETSSKPVRLKKKTSHVKEVEATVNNDGTVTYSEPDTGEQVLHVIDSIEDFRFAIGECQLLKKKALEVSARLFEHLTMGKPTPYLIYGNPAVKVYCQGSMDRIEKIESLTIEELIELKAKKARKVAEEERIKRESMKAELEL